MNSKRYRISELINPADGRSLVIDTSKGLVLGVLPGLEHFSDAVSPLLPLLDGIVTSPGQARRLGQRNHQEAGLVIRADWTNALRGDKFVLPPETTQYIPLLKPADALDLGANAVVMNFILGHDEEIEARCMQQVVNWALEGLSLGMPLLVEVQPIGPRVVLMDKAIELGVSYALEGGADGVIIPWPGPQSFKTIQGMGNGLPVWVRADDLDPSSPELDEALQLGAAGLWLDERLFAAEHPFADLESLKNLVHASVVG